MGVWSDTRKTDAAASKSGKGLEQARAIALSARCPVETETAIRDILASKPSKSDRAQALLDVGHARGDLPFIQNRVLSELLKLDTERARQFIKYIIRDAVDFDHEHVRVRAYTALVELPEKTVDDARIIMKGLTERSRAVHSGIVNEINSLEEVDRQKLRELLGMIEPIAAGASKLQSLLESSEVSQPSMSVPPSKVVRPQDEKLIRARCIATRVIPEGGSNDTPTRTQMSTSIKVAPIDVRDPRPKPPPPAQEKMPFTEEVRAQSSSGQATAGRKHPERGTDTSLWPRTLEEMRRPEFRSMKWSELLAQRDSLADPHSVCACLAEMRARFSPPMLVRDAIADRLCWVIAHNDPELKHKAGILMRQLF
jgi:hypothetical protein